MEVFAQSLAASGPSVALALTPSLVFLTAGRNTLWSFLVAIVIVLLVAFNAVPFARRHAAAGSLYTWTTAGIGSGAGFACAWALVIGYAGIAALNIAGVALFGSAVVTQAGGDGTAVGVRLPILIVAVLFVLLVPIRGIQLSSRVGLVLEILSLVAIAILFISIVIHFGFKIDSTQFHFAPGSINHVFVGAVIGVSAFVGFESAGSLGAEARDPFRTIPRTLIAIVLAIGAAYAVGSYIEVLGFGRKADLAASAAPLNALADYAGVPELAYVLDLGLVFATAACASATLNASARTLYSLSNEQALPRIFGRTHSIYRTPHLALIGIWTIISLVAFIFVVDGVDLLTQMGYGATVATFGFLIAYLFVSVSAPVFLLKAGEFRVQYAIVGGAAVIAIGYVIWNSIIPVPPAPYDRLPFIFLGIWALGLLWYVFLRLTKPEAAARIGALSERLYDADQGTDDDPAN